MPPRDPTTHRLQRLKGEGLGLRRFGFDAESGLSQEPVDEGGPVLDALEPVLHDHGQLARRAAGAEIAQASLHVRQVPSAFSSGAYAGSRVTVSAVRAPRWRRALGR
jgi:hypothetical protein